MVLQSFLFRLSRTDLALAKKQLFCFFKRWIFALAKKINVLFARWLF